jgi:hypothetical protein
MGSCVSAAKCLAEIGRPNTNDALRDLSARSEQTKMNSHNFIVSYMQYCTSGALTRSECGPMWQMMVIVTLLLLAIATLIVLRIYSAAARSRQAA